MVAVLLTAAEALTAAEGSDRHMRITVQLYNQVNAPQREIRQAKATVSWMFQKAGIDVRWVECPLSQLASTDQLCGQPDDPTLFVLSITAADPPDHSLTALGFALVQGRANHAAALYPRIRAMAEKNPQFKNDILLGSVIAHELAHLLFHSTQHGEGIMRAAWTKREFRAMTQNRLVFTEQQAQTLRRMLAARIGICELPMKLSSPNASTGRAFCLSRPT
jgi:hypothetical protein